VTGVTSSVIIGTLLLLLLLLVRRKAALGTRELPPQWDSQRQEQQIQLEAYPPEMAARVFSRKDREFVAGLENPMLKELFRAERKSLALLWVQQTSQAIQKIMREHTELTRRSADLEFTTEMKLFFRYAELRLLCGFLLISIDLAGPFWWGGLASYAGKLSQRLGQANDALIAATEPGEIRRINSY